MRTRMRADSKVTSTPDSSSRLSCPIVVDYTTQDFSEVLSGYDLVIDSLGGQNLEKSLIVLKPHGLVIGVAGPPDAGFAHSWCCLSKVRTRSSRRG